MSRVPLTSRNWFGKASAGLICGFMLALALCGLFARFATGGLGAGQLQFAMWLMAPIWSLIFSFCFFFRDGPRAWGWLGGAALLAYAPLLFG